MEIFVEVVLELVVDVVVVVLELVFLYFFDLLDDRFHVLISDLNYYPLLNCQRIFDLQILIYFFRHFSFFPLLFVIFPFQFFFFQFQFLNFLILLVFYEFVFERFVQRD